VWGFISGQEVCKFMETDPELPGLSEATVQAEEKRLFEDILQRDGSENPYDIRRELRATMDKHVGVYRDGEELAAGLEKVKALRQRFANIKLEDRGRIYNTNLFHVLEIENLLDLAEVMITGALARTESRGGHSRRDYTVRDDDNWLKHTLAWKDGDGVRLDYKSVTINKWKPVERKY
jgi:succinate dehydrogenase / fumarate reductase flavoprotein subunit